MVLLVPHQYPAAAATIIREIVVEIHFMKFSRG
jgi:hypothetical protein